MGKKVILSFTKDIFASRKLLVKLTKYDFRQKYLQTYLGIVWAFIHPIIIVALLWLVFSAGFRSQPINNFPFVLWLIAGIIPWFFFADGLTNASNALVDNRYLVNKIVFRVSLLPIIKILSSLTVHLFLMLFVILIYFSYGFIPDLYTLQLIYYLFALCMLILAISWTTSAIVVFLGDMKQLIAILIQVGFWATPVFWSLNLIPEKYHTYIKLNPMVYIIEGYRNSLIDKIWFWEKWDMTLYFWFSTIFIMLFGVFVFRKLKPYFADVL
jgi:lipopolysaccharide transport system permease protein/teichoic acid transport system permease protein